VFDLKEGLATSSRLPVVLIDSAAVEAEKPQEEP
jgi:hypothetical protein